MSDRNSNGADGADRNLRQSAIEAYDHALDSAYSTGRRANDMIEDSPLLALGAGLAAGALVAALIPATRRERELLAPYGNRVTGAARDAVDAARKAGSDKLRELGLTPDVLAEKAGEAAKATAQAAVGKLREGGKS